MEEISLSETETRYYSDLFVCCDVEKTGKIPFLKATELFRSANLSNDAIRQITTISGIPQKALHISRTEFFSCLKLIAAYQASIPLRTELLSSSGVNLPLPRFSWKNSPPLVQRNVPAPPLPTTASNSDANNISTMNSIASTDSNGLITTDESRKNSLGNASKESRQWREVHSPNFVECTGNAAAQDTANSDLHSTDSEVEHNEINSGRVNRRNRGGSPEAWSTNSDSPTPTNSVAERPWAKDTMWQGLLGDEHRQLLGTEEESSDRHSSEDDNETDIETLYQITNEQREYYHKQFKAVQPDPNGLLSGHIARVFFEKSRIPIEELRHIWQVCDVTRDGALSLNEFTAAMHLVVLRRNNIPLPSVLPACLHPTVLTSANSNQLPIEPPEADLLHLDDEADDDNDDENTATIVDGSVVSNANSTVVTTTTKNVSSSDIGRAKDKDFNRTRPDKTSLKLNTLNSSLQTKSNESCSTSSPPSMGNLINRSIPNTPPIEPLTPPIVRHKDPAKDWTNQSKEWTKFSESPTSNVSSPGPKPVNFDMQRTAQAVVSDPQILHPVPLRVTPVGTDINEDESSRLSRKSENLVYDTNTGILRENESSPKQIQQQSHQHRDSLQNNDLRAIQRPQAKKLPSKNIGAIPPPPQRETSINGSDGIESSTLLISSNNSIGGDNSGNLALPNKKDPPPLPPPRPHRHARSSSLDLNKLKMSGNPSQPEMVTQASLDVQTDSVNIAFADFTHFPEANKIIPEHVQPPPPRPTISTLQTNNRASAFEVYRKPNTPRSSQSPDSQLQLQQIPSSTMTGSVGASGALGVGNLNVTSSSLVPSTNSSSSSTSINVEFDKRVNAISETLRHVSLKNEKNVGEVLRHLREQNGLLLRLCNDLSEELLQVQQRKEELRLKLENSNSIAAAGGNNTAGAGNSAISGSISSNATGGSCGSGTLHSNV